MYFTVTVYLFHGHNKFISPTVNLFHGHGKFIIGKKKMCKKLLNICRHVNEHTNSHLWKKKSICKIFLFLGGNVCMYVHNHTYSSGEGKKVCKTFLMYAYMSTHTQTPMGEKEKKRIHEYFLNVCMYVHGQKKRICNWEVLNVCIHVHTHINSHHLGGKKKEFARISWMYACMDVCMYRRMHVWMYACASTLKKKDLQEYLECVHACMMCVCVCVWGSPTYVRMYVRILMYVYVHACMCACVYTHKQAHVWKSLRNSTSCTCSHTHTHIQYTHTHAC
jgi:hypothetical protein